MIMALNAEQDENDEPFELLGKPLGQGGFATTYYAKVLSEELVEEFGADKVALKIPLSKMHEKALKVELAMFITLNSRLKGVPTDNLVPFLGFGIFRKQHVIAMRFIPNGNLRQYVRTHGKGARSQKFLPIDEAIRVASEVTRGLQIIHGEQILHRDIKPENVLMDGQTAKVADFGLSRILHTNQLAPTRGGTPPYMSPEILFSGGASFPTDIWSLGVMLYEMVTGRLPFGDYETPEGARAISIRDDKQTPAHERNSDVPRTLSDIIDRTLAKQPSERPTAKELLNALLECTKKADDLEKDLTPIRELMIRADAGREVEAKLRQLICRYPKHSKAYQELGEFYNRCQRYADALDVLRKGLEHDPEHALLLWDCASAAQMLGRNADAVQYLRKALALNLDPSLKRFAQAQLRAIGGGVE